MSLKKNKCVGLRVFAVALGLAIISLFASGPRAHAQTWDNASGGNYDTDTNWSSGSAPGPGSSVFLPDLSTNYTINFNDPITNVFSFITDGDATLNLLTDNEYVVANVASIGDTSASDITVNNGGLLAARNMRVGRDTTGDGILRMLGSNTELFILEILGIGDFGNGSVHVRDGADAFSSQTQLGVQPGSFGILQVINSGSTQVADLGVVVGGAGGGFVVVGDGGIVHSKSFTTIGFTSSGGGEIVVNGTGSGFLSDAALSVGNQGSGKLTIETGGLVSVLGDVPIARSADPTKTGIVKITGADTLGTPAALQSTGNIFVGVAGTGTLSIIDGGLAESLSSGVIIGRDATANGLAEVDNATLRTAQGMIVGLSGRGEVKIRNAGMADIAGAVTVGDMAGLTTTSKVEVFGTGSELSAGNVLTVGNFGKGEVGAFAGGTISVPSANIAANADSMGLLEVGGSTTNLNIANAVYVGGTASNIHGGAAELRVMNDARATATSVRLYETGTVNIASTGNSRLEIGTAGAFPVIPAAANVYDGGVLEMRQGELNAHRVVVHQGSGPDQVDGDGIIHADVTNRGYFAPGIQFNTDLEGNSGPMSGIIVNGDYEQSADGVFVAKISALNQHIEGGDNQYGMRVIGEVNLAGAVKFDIVGAHSPTLGKVYDLIRYEEGITGRFGKVMDSAIDDDKFFALRYQADSNINPLNSGGQIQALVVETPRVAGGGRLTAGGVAVSGGNNLVINTHGTGDSANDWTAALSNAMATNLHAAASSTTITSFDWSPFNGGDVTGAILASNNAGDIGESLVLWMEEVGLNPAHVHVSGHSAGSWFVDGVTDRLAIAGFSASTHGTVWDAFVPGAGIVRVGLPSTLFLDHVDYAEHVVDTFEAVAGTNELFSNVFNIDVTSIYEGGPGNPIQHHSWPYRWYRDTAIDPNDADLTISMLYGWPKSYEATGIIPTYDALHAQGRAVKIFGPGDARIFTPPGFFGPVVFFNDLPSVTEGDVTLNADNSATLTTASPAMLTIMPTLTESANVMQFDYDFSDGPLGSLSVYVDGELSFLVDQDNVFYQSASASTDGLLSTGTIFLPSELDANIHTILFRLDPLEAGDATITVSNLVFDFVEFETLSSADFDMDGDVDGSDFLSWQRGLSPSPATDLALWQDQYGNIEALATATTAVPEPSTLAMLGMALFGTFLARRKRPMH